MGSVLGFTSTLIVACHPIYKGIHSVLHFNAAGFRENRCMKFLRLPALISDQTMFVVSGPSNNFDRFYESDIYETLDRNPQKMLARCNQLEL